MDSAGGSQTGRRNPVKSLWNVIRSRSVRDNIIAGLILSGFLWIIPLGWTYFLGEATVQTPQTPTPMRLSVACEVPRFIWPGEVIELIYDINAPVAVDVGLGAALYDEKKTDRSTGVGDVDARHLSAGSQRVTRPFAVPTELESGFYELTAQVWPANKIGSEGVETLADASCGIATIP